jgi:hypothetical protein
MQSGRFRGREGVGARFARASSATTHPQPLFDGGVAGVWGVCDEEEAGCVEICEWWHPQRDSNPLARKRKGPK